MWNRRTLLQAAGLTTASSFFAPLLSQLMAKESAASAKELKSCIVLFLEGGPSHIDLFDPKPGTKHGGPVEAIDTAIRGAKFGQYVPRLAAAAKDLAVIRTLHSKEGDHERAQVLLHTGYAPNPALEYPALGATVSLDRSSTTTDVPAYISIGSVLGTGGGFLGPEFSPFVVNDVYNPAPNLQLPEEYTDQRLKKRMRTLEKLNTQFAQTLDNERVESFTKLTQRADRFRKSPALQPYDLSTEKPDLLQAYGVELGDGNWGRACLMARRLVENGVKFVEVVLNGWDTHENNFGQVEDMGSRLDAALSTLIFDLKQRGLLDSTLVVCCGEFGRTPEINGQQGRDHWNDAFFGLLAGGGIKAGQIIGSTDDDGGQPKDRPVTVPEFHATIFKAIGLDPATPHKTPDGRSVKFTDQGKPISELI